MSKLTAEHLVEDCNAEERAMLERVEGILPALAARSGDMDQNSYLSPDNVKTLGDAGLLGLVAPKDYGGLGGGLRVWAGACFAIGTVCPSTALAYFFHLTSASRGNLSPRRSTRCGRGCPAPPCPPERCIGHWRHRCPPGWRRPGSGWRCRWRSRRT